MRREMSALGHKLTSTKSSTPNLILAPLHSPYAASIPSRYEGRAREASPVA